MNHYCGHVITLWGALSIAFEIAGDCSDTTELNVLTSVRMYLYLSRLTGCGKKKHIVEITLIFS